MDDEERKAHKDKLNCFCFVCGKFTPKGDRRHLTDLAINCYDHYFAIRPVAELKNVNFAPEFSCITCIGALNG